MLKRNLVMGLVLILAVSLTGCKCCGLGSSTCNSPALISAAPIAPAPCNNCGTPPPGGVAVPPPPGAVVPGPAPAPQRPYGASYSRKI